MEAGLFPLGTVVITVNAQRTLNQVDVIKCLLRHSKGDWGELDEHDQAENAKALGQGYRLFSSYHDQAKVKFYIITEADRSVTTILLPEDY